MTYTIPLENKFAYSSPNEMLLSAIFELPLENPDRAVRDSEYMASDLRLGVEVAKAAIAATGKEWVPALCGHNVIPVAYCSVTNEVAEIITIEEERFLLVKEPWGPVALAVWQEINK